MRQRVRFIITIALLCVVGVLVYYRYSNNTPSKSNNSEENETTISEVDRLINKDLENGYPITAREVVNLFTRIQKCYYNEEYTQDELVSLSYMATKLFDEELLTVNSYDEYYADLQDEIDEYKEAGKTISRVIVDKSSDVVYSTIEGVKYASIKVIYYLKTNDATEKTVEVYTLRKDEEDRWKILGWMLYEESEE